MTRVEQVCQIQNKLGLHLRAAAAFVITSMPIPRCRQAAITMAGGKVCFAPVPSTISSGFSAKIGSRSVGDIVAASRTGQSSTSASGATTKLRSIRRSLTSADAPSAPRRKYR